MTILLDLQPDVEKQLQTLAQAQGIAPAEYAHTLFQRAVAEQLRLRQRNAATVAVLDAFLQEDADEQRETWEALQTGLATSRQATRRDVP